MDEKQYVCHISGQGEKWLVDSEQANCWSIKGSPYFLHLPKSEYRLCDQPECWIDVTQECEVRTDSLNRQQIWHKQTCIDGATGYQFRKAQCWSSANGQALTPLQCQWVFLVERKETP